MLVDARARVIVPAFGAGGQQNRATRLSGRIPVISRPSPCNIARGARDDPLRVDVERAFQALQKLKSLLNSAAAQREVLPVPQGEGSGGAVLSNEQCRQIADKLFPLANYACRLKTRFQRRRLRHDDPLFVATAELQDALQRVRMSFTYQSNKRESNIIPWDDPRIAHRRPS
jgi:hypothetical protein